MLDQTLEKAAITQTFHRVPNMGLICLTCVVWPPDTDSEPRKRLKGMPPCPPLLPGSPLGQIPLLIPEVPVLGPCLFRRLVSQACCWLGLRAAFIAEVVDGIKTDSSKTRAGFSCLDSRTSARNTSSVRMIARVDQVNGQGWSCGEGRLALATGSDFTADSRSIPGPCSKCSPAAHEYLNHKSFLGLILHVFHFRGKKLQFWFKTIYLGNGP